MNYNNNDIDNTMTKTTIVPFTKKKSKINKFKSNRNKIRENKNQIIDVDHYNKNKNYIIKEGNKIYKENNFLSKIWDIMSDKTFSDFFDSYLNDYSDVQVAMVFFNIYKCVKQEYFAIFKKNISKEEMVFILREIMRNNFMRKYMIQNTKDKNLIQLQQNIIQQDIQQVLHIQNKKLLDIK